MMNVNKTIRLKMRTLLICITLLIISASLTVAGYRHFDAYSELQHEESINRINKLEWSFIDSILTENIQKSNIQATEVAKNIESEILQEYSNLDELKLSVENRNYDDTFLKITTDNITNKYIGVENYSNDMWVADKSGIICDLSLDCASEEPQRYWKTEIGKHYNEKLAKLAIEALNSQSSELVFWEYKSPEDTSHKLITKMNKSELYEVFTQEGISGLKTYEFLCPAYITPDGDIFGTSDVSLRGQKQDTYKLIVVQGFNIYDQLIETHKPTMIQFEEQREQVINSYERSKELRDGLVLLLTTFEIVLVAVLMKVYNGVFTCLLEETKYRER